MRKFIRAVLVGSAVCLSFAATAHVVRAAATEPSHADAKGEPGEPPEKGVPLDFKGDLALWSGITFVIFVMLLGRYAWGPLIAALNKRQAHIRDDIAAAELCGSRPSKCWPSMRKRWPKSKTRSAPSLPKAAGMPNTPSRKSSVKRRKRRKTPSSAALHEIGRARGRGAKDLFDVMASQVAQATEHVLGRSVTGADQDRLIRRGFGPVSAELIGRFTTLVVDG